MQYHDFDAETFGRKLAQDDSAILVDVRTPQEYEAAHIPGAVNINMYDPEFYPRVQELDKNRPVYLYCRSGSRSHGAAELLTRIGFRSVFNLRRGIVGWTGPITQPASNK